ncbi:hypothetical protein [Streptomyces sp. NPDC052535]|uniref:hypothetical protein n=1 Tax=Streptomyces sp. NPDC052535 TaxID=3155531 RepID=UPI003439686F
MSPQPGREEEPVQINVTVDTSGFIDALWKARANLLFGWNPELVELDDELDIMYRGQL